MAVTAGTLTTFLNKFLKKQNKNFKKQSHICQKWAVNFLHYVGRRSNVKNWIVLYTFMSQCLRRYVKDMCFPKYPCQLLNIFYFSTKYKRARLVFEVMSTCFLKNEQKLHSVKALSSAFTFIHMSQNVPKNNI